MHSLFFTFFAMSIFHVGRLSYKKASKNENFHTKIIFGESMGSKLSKTVLGMSVGGLERILRHSPCWSEIVKNHKKSWFFAFFAKPLDHVLHHIFGSKRFKNIWGSVLESLWSVLSISKFFQKFGTFCNPNGILQFHHKNPTFFPLYRSGYKKASKM